MLIIIIIIFLWGGGEAEDGVLDRVGRMGSRLFFFALRYDWNALYIFDMYDQFVKGESGSEAQIFEYYDQICTP